MKQSTEGTSTAHLAMFEEDVPMALAMGSHDGADAGRRERCA